MSEAQAIDATLTRPGDRGDIPQITRMALEFWPQTGYGIPADTGSIIRLAARCIDEGLMTILEVEGAAVGFLAGLKAPCIANDQVIIGSEIAYWIDPEYRSEGNGYLLLTAAEQAAEQAGVHVWSMMSLEAVEPDKVDRLYKSMGYVPGEHSYSKRLAAWQQ